MEGYSWAGSYPTPVGNRPKTARMAGHNMLSFIPFHRADLWHTTGRSESAQALPWPSPPERGYASLRSLGVGWRRRLRGESQPAMSIARRDPGAFPSGDTADGRRRKKAMPDNHHTGHP
jgi:hypothetical protein